MFRRMLSLLFVLLMLPAALAEEYNPYQVITFSGSLPETLKAPLSTLVTDESTVLSGAAIQHNGDNAYHEPAHKDAHTALVLSSTADGPRLYAAAWVDGLPWQVNDFTHFLRSARNVSVSIYRPQSTQVPVFSVDYYDQQGLTSDLFCFWNNQLWCMDGHINQSQNTSIANDMGMLAVTDDIGRESFRCDSPFFLDYMEDISAFPTSRAEVQALTWLPEYAPYAAGMLLYSEGANLRREPTTKSESLGQYARNTPMTFTGEQKQGPSWPWYQVRIGDTVGWMSGNYVDDEPNLGYAPVPLGRTLTSCALYASSGDDQPLLQLEPGTTFHILTEHKDMYHICIPQGNISWAVDAAGIYGYIPTKNILTGASISALDAQAAR